MCIWYLLTDSDLDTGLVELDGGRPGDEAGTEKKDLVDHDCGLLSEWVLIDRRSERSHVKCKQVYYSAPSMAHKSLPWPALCWATDNPHQREASCRDVGVQMFRQMREPQLAEPQALLSQMRYQ